MAAAEQWERIVEWCELNAPITSRALRRGNESSVVDAAIEATAVNWPDELRVFYQLQNGMQRRDTATGRFTGSVLPMHDLLSLDEVLHTRANMLAVTGEMMADDPVVSPEAAAESIRRLEHDVAGSQAGLFLSAFIPIAERNGYNYFFDTRTGPRSGCVTQYAHSDADMRGPIWANISQMLEIHADALGALTTVKNFQPIVVDGILDWHQIDRGSRPATPPGSLNPNLRGSDDEKVKNEVRRRLLGR